MQQSKNLPYEGVNSKGMCRSCQNKLQDSAVAGSVVTISAADRVEESPLLPQQSEGK